MKKLFGEFKKFITRGNVIDMAVGVAVASAFTAIVTAFTKGFITPLLTLLTGESDLDEMRWVVREAITKPVLDANGQPTFDAAGKPVVEVLEDEVALMWGPLVHAIMDFFIIALALFTVIKVVSTLRNRAEKLSKKARDLFTDADEKEAAAAAEAAAKLEEEQRAAEEAKAAAEAAEAAAKAEAERIEAEKIAAEEARLARQEQLLTDIRDLLKAKAE